MAIRLKVAKTPEEIDDALWVRHEVFIVEDGKFGGKPAPDARMMDRFDALPDVYNIIAYDGNEPIATIRLTKESEIGLPADEHFDFSEFRKSAESGSTRSNGNGHDRDAGSDADVVFGSAGMLAVRQPWRNRRDVIRTMYRIAAGVCRSTDVTHIVAVTNHRTAGMYQRLGFAPLAEKFWSAGIGDHIVPLAATSNDFCSWAFDDLPDTPLGMFRNGFERLFVRSGETIFLEGDSGHDAYIVGSGHVCITVKGHDGTELTLARQNRGDLFGEFALIDAMPRSATAVATVDSELITLDRNVFHQEIINHPERILQLLEIFTRRIRRMDELMSTLVSAPQTKRLEFALGLERIQTIQDAPRADDETFDDERSDHLDYDYMTPEITTRQVFENAHRRGEFHYSKGQIRFAR